MSCLGNMCFTGALNTEVGWTISSVMHAIQFIYYLPASLAIHIINKSPALYTFFEIDSQSGTGWGGFVFATFCWWCCFALISEEFTRNKE